MAEDGEAVLVEALPGFRDADAARRPMNQRDVERSLERLHMLRDGGRSQQQLPRGSRKALGFHNRHKAAK